MPLPTDNVNEIEDAEIVSETKAPTAPPAPPASVGATAPPPPPAQASAPATAPPPPPAQASAPATAPPPPPAQASAPATAPPPAAAEVTVPAAAPPLATPPEAPAAQVPAAAQPTGMAVAPVNPMVQAAAEDGFEGLDFDGFGAFPMVSLKQGSFSCSEGYLLTDPFYAILNSSRKKFIYKNGLDDKDPLSEFFYTYDQYITISGDLVEDKLNEWRAKGWAPNIKPYIDAVMTLKGGEHENKMVILSIPKTSISRFSAHWANMRATGLPKEQILTKISKGAMITSGKFDWTPITFEIYTG